MSYTPYLSRYSQLIADLKLQAKRKDRDGGHHGLGLERLVGLDKVDIGGHHGLGLGFVRPEGEGQHGDKKCIGEEDHELFIWHVSRPRKAVGRFEHQF